MNFSNFLSPCCSTACFHIHVADALSPYHRLECRRCGAVFHLSVAFMPQLTKEDTNSLSSTPGHKPLNPVNQHFTSEGFAIARRKHWFELQREKYFESRREEHWIATGRYLRPPGTVRKAGTKPNKSLTTPQPPTKSLKELLDELN